MQVVDLQRWQQSLGDVVCCKCCNSAVTTARFPFEADFGMTMFTHSSWLSLQ